MKLVMIGSGNVATVLSRLMKRNGHSILQVMSRNIDHARHLAEELNADYSDMTCKANASADMVIMAISDDGLTGAFPDLQLDNKLIAHTAGSSSKDILKSLSENYGVLYPLQSLLKDNPDMPEIPFLVDGCRDETTTLLENFATTISPLVARVSDDARLKMHAAAVIVSNFTNHLYSMAEDFCVKEGVDFNMLKPLIVETADRVRTRSPSKLQTGPAIRKDIQTLDKHLRLFTNHPKLRTTYLRLTDSIMNP